MARLDEHLEILDGTAARIFNATKVLLHFARPGIARAAVARIAERMASAPTFQDRKNLLYLIDSVAQNSHKLFQGQNVGELRPPSVAGIDAAGAACAYLPEIAAALPLLLRNAAPPGACLGVVSACLEVSFSAALPSRLFLPPCVLGACRLITLRCACVRTRAFAALPPQVWRWLLRTGRRF